MRCYIIETQSVSLSFIAIHSDHMSVNNVVTETLEIVDHNLQASDFDLETLTKSSYIYQLYLLNGEKQTRIVLPEVTSEQKSIKNTRLRERTGVGYRVWDLVRPKRTRIRSPFSVRRPPRRSLRAEERRAVLRPRSWTRPW